MKRFRVAVITVLGSYGLTYVFFVFMLYRNLAAHQLPEDHPKFTPDDAWVLALVPATMVFAGIAVVGFVLTVMWSVFEYCRSRRLRHASNSP